jgi:hypothetical protein
LHEAGSALKGRQSFFSARESLVKRAICLSALLMGASVSSIATAAPNDAPAKTLVAQASAPNDTSPSASVASPQPAAAIGSSPGAAQATPVKDQPQQSPAEPAPKPAPRPFAGSSLLISHSMSTATVFRSQQPDYNPSVEGALWLLPRYAISKDFQLRMRAIVNFEYTNSDSTTRQNEPLLSDTTFDLFYRGIPAIATIKPAIALNVGLPTSKVSRARTMIFSPGATLQLVKGIEQFLGGSATIMSTVAYSHPVYASRSAEVVDPRPPGSFQCAGGSACSDLLAGTLNTSDTLSYSLMFSPQWGHFSPGILYRGANQWTYEPREVRTSDLGQPGLRDEVITSGQEAPRNVRQTHFFSAWVDYNFTSWVTGEIGYQMARNVLDADGSVGNPIFSRYQDTRAYLSFSFQLDNIVQMVSGGSNAQGGIVRAQNKQPFGAL